MLARGLHCFQHELRSRFTKRRKNSPSVQPADSDFAENIVPIKIAWFELACRRVAPIGNPYRAPHTKPALGEIQAVANRSPHSVERNPLDKFGIHSALKDEVFNQSADLVVSQRGANCRFEAETPPQSARHVVFATSFPEHEFPGGPNPSLSRIQAQHDFS